MARDVTSSNIALSFIDVLASALGAAVLLFVILASTPPQVISRARAVGTFVRYEWSIKVRLLCFGSKFILRIRRILLIGSSPTPLPGMFLSGARTEPTPFLPLDLHRIQMLHLHGHMFCGLSEMSSGSWRIGLLYYDRTGDVFLQAPAIDVTATVPLVDSKSAVRGDPELIDKAGSTPVVAGQPVKLQWAQELRSPVVEETGRRENHCLKKEI